VTGAQPPLFTFHLSLLPGSAALRLSLFTSPFAGTLVFEEKTMQPKLDMEGVTVIDRTKVLINRLAIWQTVILFGIMLLLGPLLTLDLIGEGARADVTAAETTTLAKVWHYVAIVLTTLDSALPRVSGGTFFYYCIAILATACGAYGFGVRSWSLIVLGFWMVAINLVATVCNALWNVLSGVWHLLAFLFYLLSEWGIREGGHPHLVATLSCIMGLAIAFVIFRLAFAALKPAFQGVLLVGRAQEMDSGLLEFLSPFEGRTHSEILTLLFRNTLMRLVGYSLVGHLVAITVMSVPSFIEKAQDAWKESRALVQEKAEMEKSRAPAVKGSEKGKEAGKETGKEPATKDKGGEKGGEVGPEPGVEFKTPAAKPKTGGDDDEPDGADTKPTGNAEDYEKHKKEKKSSGDPDFEALE
jgi:hypothetical protein